MQSKLCNSMAGAACNDPEATSSGRATRDSVTTGICARGPEGQPHWLKFRESLEILTFRGSEFRMRSQYARRPAVASIQVKRLGARRQEPTPAPTLRSEGPLVEEARIEGLSSLLDGARFLCCCTEVFWGSDHPTKKRQWYVSFCTGSSSGPCVLEVRSMVSA